MERPTELFPEIEPYSNGFMHTDDGHSIYYEQCGNPQGKPLIHIHGGPGAGCDPTDRRYVDPQKWRHILFDQRGSGRSKPFGSCENNTTQHLVADIRKLMKHLGIEKAVLQGGSWGTTLSLIYAIAHPETVSGMVLRGVFLAEKAEIDFLYGGQLKWFFPDIWERFMGVESPMKKDLLNYYHHQLTSPNAFRRRYYAEEWSRYELAILHLIPRTEEETDKELHEFPFESMAIMETHYFMNNCFIEEGFIMKNTDKLPRVPTVIVQGRYDMVCPPVSAYRLHKALPWSELHMTLAGHSGSDPETRKKVISETDALFDKI